MASFDGFVLCGGASRRMGCDKALLEVDGVAMARRVADALHAAGARRVVAVGGDALGLAALGLEHRPDRWPGEGPLGGLLTALGDPDGDPDPEAAPVAVVLSCDLLQPDPEAIAEVVEARQRLGCDVVVPVVDGRHQWLHAAWDRRVTGILADVFAAGERSLAGAALAVRMATTEHIAAPAVHDADRPEDLPAGRGAGTAAGSPSIVAVQIPAIDVTELREQLDAGAPLVDVRQPDEYEQAHVADARLIPLGEVVERVGEIPTDQTVYLICRSGNRSGKAVEYLRGNGVDAVNVTGGMLAWIDAGNAVETGA